WHYGNRAHPERHLPGGGRPEANRRADCASLAPGEETAGEVIRRKPTGSACRPAGSCQFAVIFDSNSAIRLSNGEGGGSSAAASFKYRSRSLAVSAGNSRRFPRCSTNTEFFSITRQPILPMPS